MWPRFFVQACIRREFTRRSLGLKVGGVHRFSYSNTSTAQFGANTNSRERRRLAGKWIGRYPAKSRRDAGAPRKEKTGDGGKVRPTPTFRFSFARHPLTLRRKRKWP
jgi:hypothetical protein